MNLHPLIVHFPIGLLVAYAIAEAVWIIPGFRGPRWAHLRGVLAISGTAAAFLALPFGEIAEGMVLAAHPEKAPIIDMHSQFATVSSYLFLALAAGYALAFLSESRPGWFSRGVGRAVARLRDALQFPALRILAALAGLVTITITGALGASIVYGPDIDPFVSGIYRLFF